MSLFPFPFFRPPSEEEARNNAIGNKTNAEPLWNETKRTAHNVWKTLVSTPAYVGISVPLSLTAKMLNAGSNIVGLTSITGYRVAKHVEDTRGKIRKAVDMDWMFEDTPALAA